MVPTGIVEEQLRPAFRELVKHIEPQLHIIQGEVKPQRNRLLVRFPNDFGLQVLQFLAGKPPLFVVMVLRFLGPGTDDYRLAQYIPIPELHWLRRPEEILALGYLVASLPAKRADFKKWENLAPKKVA